MLRKSEASSIFYDFYNYLNLNICYRDAFKEKDILEKYHILTKRGFPRSLKLLYGGGEGIGFEMSLRYIFLFLTEIFFLFWCQFFFFNQRLR